MDILFLTSAHPPFDPRIYHKMFTSLKSEGYDVKILLPNQVELSNTNDNFISFDGHLGKWSRFLNNFRLIRKCIALKPNIIFFFDPDLLPFMDIYKLIFKSIVVFDNHEDYPSYIFVKDYVPVWARKILGYVFLVFYRLGKSILDYIIYSDQFTTGIDLSRHNEGIIYNYPIIVNYPLVEKKYDLIYPGSIDLNICQRLLKIAEEEDKICTQKIKFLIIGRDVSDTNRILIKKYTNDFKNIEMIFYEDLPYDSVQSYISESKIGIIPMPDIDKFRRNIPTKLFEFMMHSIPILASDLPSISYFLKDTKGNFLIDEENYSVSYSKKINEILANYSYFSATSQNNYNRLINNWNWEKTEKPKLINLVQILLKNNADTNQ